MAVSVSMKMLGDVNNWKGKGGRVKVFIYGQPIFRLEDDNTGIRAVEVLARGNNTSSAKEIIEYIKKNRLQKEFDMNIMEQLAEVRLPDDIAVNINLCKETVATRNAFQLISRKLDNIKTPRENIFMEINEDTDLDDAYAIDCINKLHDYGVKISVDDYGTGATSRKYAVSMRADQVKLDRSIVKEIASMSEYSGGQICEGYNREFIEAGAEVVVEGVETLSELSVLWDHGIRLVQGFLLCKPMPIERFCAVARRREHGALSKIVLCAAS